MTPSRRSSRLHAPAWGAFALVLLMACSGDDGPTGPDGPETSPQRGDVSGQVAATDGRGGVEGAVVALEGPGDVEDDAVTDESGRYRFADLEPGEYRLELTPPQGYEASGSIEETVEVDGDVTVDFESRPVQSETQTVPAGESDTLATGSGAFMEVDATDAASDVEVTLEESGSTLLDDENPTTRPVRLRVNPPGAESSTSGMSARVAAAYDAAADGDVTVRVWQDVDGDPANSSFVLDAGTEDDPLRLYADGESTTYTDPETGVEREVKLKSFQTSPEADVDALVAAAAQNDTCGDERRQLEPVADDDTGDKALVFIHGWQIDVRTCSDIDDENPDTDAFSTLLDELDGTGIDDAYRFYTYTYPTNAPVLAGSDGLWQEMQDSDITRPVLVGHSMGGLVARGLLQQQGDDAVAGVITLGTPHEGTAIANMVSDPTVRDEIATAVDCSLGPFDLVCVAALLDAALLPDTEGLLDLRTDSDLVTALKEAQADPRKVYTVGGSLGSADPDARPSDPVVGKVYDAFAALLRTRFDEPTDGVVPVSSATPGWTTLQTVLEGHHHLELTGGDADRPDVLFDQVEPPLRTIASCEPPPERPETNDFELSGSVARQAGRTVRVTLNAIMIDGELVTDLTADDVTVVENGCVRDVSDFSSENVGVDLVFAQDMSGSMGGAISGVRSSVISFADDLAGRGVDVRIGSIGYSGPGDIPSTPGPSPCEFLGPLRDLTDPVTFQGHVSDAWVATGGCDAPENALEAIEHAHENLSWRSGAARAYIDITDISHHTESTNCNGLGACTDQSLASITGLVGETSTIHAVAPESESARTADGGLDPWALADETGGETLVLPPDGVVDLTTIGITDVVGEAVTFTFESASPREANHTLRIRVEVGDQVAELAPDLVRYQRLDPSLQQ